MKACKNCGAPCKRVYCEKCAAPARAASSMSVQLAHAQALRDQRRDMPDFVFDKSGNVKVWSRPIGK